MINRIILLFVLGFVLMDTQSMAQQFGGNPSSIKWKQINTDTARIIFPEGVEPTAARVATVVHELQKSHPRGIGKKFDKVNIVLQNQNILPNGYVGLGPWRSEFYLFAPQNTFEQGSINWAEKLAVHEYRHIQQFSNFNVGVAKAARILFGQEGQALLNSAAVPDYFFEGDAVFNETALTRQGRGRQPLFFNGYRALYNERKQYSYQKLRSGSLKDFVPDHYELGYLLVGYGRQKYGADFWEGVTRDAARFKPLIYPWQGAMKKHTGISYKQFIKDAFQFYQSQWQTETSVATSYITKATNYNSDYKYPTAARDGSIIALKRSYREIPAFYRIDASGNEQRIATRGIAYDDYFSYNNGRIVYSSLKPHIRWNFKEYSDVYLIDAENGDRKRITSKERFVSPDISHNGERIAVVEMKTNQLSNLIIIDKDGKRLWRSNGEPGTVFAFPKFSQDDSTLFTTVRNSKGQMALRQININNSKAVDVVPFGDRLIGFPVVQGDTVLFTSTYNNQDETWAYLPGKKQVFKLASRLGGLYHAALNAGSLVASNFTAQGYRLIALRKQNILWEPIDLQGESVADLYVPAALKQEDKQTINTLQTRDFAVRNYNKAFQLFNFHSWRPTYDNPEFTYTFFGENILNTFLSELSYTYNRNEQSSKVGANLIYGGWFVQPSIGVDQTWNRTIRLNRDTTLYYNERKINIGLTLPLNLSNDRQFRNLSFSSSIYSNSVRINGIGKRFFKDQSFYYLQQRLFYAGQVQKAVQQIYPRWAQTFLIQYRNVINDYNAHQFYATGSIYLPGLHTNHSLVLNAAFSARDTASQYLFTNNFSFSRGYTSVDFPRMFRLGANYHFPLLYPDFGLANIVYFRRLRANVFYDHTQTKSLRRGTTFTFNSVGSEVFFDTRWWNQQNVSFGVRFSHLLNNEFRGVTNPNQWEIILPINLFD